MLGDKVRRAAISITISGDSHIEKKAQRKNERIPMRNGWETGSPLKKVKPFFR
jgi:hypothetical protein